MKRIKKFFDMIKEKITCRHVWEVRPNKRADSKIDAFLQCSICKSVCGIDKHEKRTNNKQQQEN